MDNGTTPEQKPPIDWDKVHKIRDALAHNVGVGEAIREQTTRRQDATKDLGPDDVVELIGDDHGLTKEARLRLAAQSAHTRDLDDLEPAQQIPTSPQ